MTTCNRRPGAAAEKPRLSPGRLAKAATYGVTGYRNLSTARSRLYRSQTLQVNTRWKALAEIYTMHSFAPLSYLKIFVKKLLKFLLVVLKQNFENKINKLLFAKIFTNFPEFSKFFRKILAKN